MRNGTCPKCSSQSVYAAGGGLKYGTQPALQAHIEPGFRGMRPAYQATDNIWQFVCADCGYLESYVLDDAAKDFVRQNWRSV